MNYLDHLTSAQQALVLGRDLDEQIQLLEHAQQSDEAEAFEVDKMVRGLESAGFRNTDLHQRARALHRSIRQTGRAISAVRHELNRRDLGYTTV